MCIRDSYYFTPPFHTFQINESEDLIALLVFVGVAMAVSWFVETAARRAAEGAAARAEAEELARLAGATPPEHLLDALARTFALDGAAILHRAGDAWSVDAAAGRAPATPQAASTTIELDGSHVLATSGPAFDVRDGRVLAALSR